MARTKPRAGAKRQAARQRDIELAEQAAAALADPRIGERIAALAATAAPRVLRYSLRNQALLAKQADERGITLTDVDTYKGWQSRGHQVRRGEHGLSIVRPVGRKDTQEGKTGSENTEHTEHAAHGEDGGDGGDGKDLKFRAMTVFEISQTDAIEDFDAPAEAAQPAQEEDPAAVLYESLRVQAERAGYLVTRKPGDTAHTAPVEVDHDAATIDIYTADAPGLGHLAGVVAAILTEQAQTPPHPAADPARDTAERAAEEAAGCG